MPKTPLEKIQMKLLIAEGDFRVLKNRLDAIEARLVELRNAYEAMAHARELLEKGVGE